MTQRKKAGGSLKRLNYPDRDTEKAKKKQKVNACAKAKAGHPKENIAPDEAVPQCNGNETKGGKKESEWKVPEKDRSKEHGLKEVMGYGHDEKGILDAKLKDKDGPFYLSVTEMWKEPEVFIPMWARFVDEFSLPKDILRGESNEGMIGREFDAKKERASRKKQGKIVAASPEKKRPTQGKVNPPTKQKPMEATENEMGCKHFGIADLMGKGYTKSDWAHYIKPGKFLDLAKHCVDCKTKCSEFKPVMGTYCHACEHGKAYYMGLKDELPLHEKLGHECKFVVCVPCGMKRNEAHIDREGGSKGKGRK